MLLQKLMSHATPMPVAVQSQQPIQNLRMPVPAFPIAEVAGAARYRVSGHDQDTQFETTEFIYADSPSNAQLKVELKGVDVAAVEKA